tara:strand:- start:132 stop:452 length:321 start_codon:yes stop_codon:yes gene_type:complete
MMEVYMEYGAVGIIVSLFVMMIVNLIKSQKAQSEDLDSIRENLAKSFTKLERTVENVEGIVIKLIERWNKSDEVSQRHREDIVKELNDVTDDLSFLKGRMNGRTGA